MGLGSDQKAPIKADSQSTMDDKVVSDIKD